jgi:uncharacterized protein with NAD-binding domain and iron-sulfur cluster
VTKIRVAILGGGVSALTTAFELTSTEELRQRYDVTVYQMGWRLGGKGASGRNREVSDRIEEHGLHIWMGFYENAFSVMRRAYKELGRDPREPLATWQEAFHRHSYIVIEEPFAGGYRPWNFVFPTNYLEPGDGTVLPTPLAYAQMFVQGIIELWEGAQLDAFPAWPTWPKVPELPTWVASLISTFAADLSGPSAVDHAKGHGTVLKASVPAPTHVVSLFASYVLKLLRVAARDDAAQLPVINRCIAYLIEALMQFAWLLLQSRVERDFEARKLWIAVNLAGAAAAGIVADGICAEGWDSIDHLDLRAWLKKHGANEVTLGSGLVRAVYDLAFAYVRGDTQRPAFAAGTAMRGMLRMLFTYKGAIFYRMQAGMGDVVAVPLYELLTRRCVRFEFFNRVTALRLSADGALVDRIEMRRQAKVKVGLDRYDPLIPVNGLPCWPSTPRYDKLEHGHELEASGINLESAWAPRFKYEEDFVLELGRDFDQVVLGVSIAALKDIARDLILASPELAGSVENVQTVQTQAMQLWLTRSTRALGWQSPDAVAEGPVLGAYYEPIDTWADMSDLLCRESWPDDQRPHSIAYFCGPFPDARSIPPFHDHAFPARELTRYTEIARSFLDARVKGLWPNAVASDAFMWELLVDLTGGRGSARLASQYLRVNIDPTERYVLSVPGSTTYRLRANQLAFANLVLTGDWTYNGINAGCVEAAVMSGMYAARALCGVPAVIVGGER